jgi:LmbE family N-acetylglucosaminyl deacetylase
VDHGADHLGTILSIWAHPDDETYLAGGLMARAVAAGSRVVCVTATRGELGSPDEQRWPSGGPLAAVRTEELQRALAELGVEEHHWLDYPDGGLVDVDQAVALRRVAELVETIRPDTVLTFGPEGMTGHPDHQTVCRWAVEAVAAAGLAPDVVHHATNTPDWLARFKPGLDQFNVFMGSEPPCTELADLSIHVRFEGDLLEQKLRAISAQVSQVQPLIDTLGETFFREGLAEESFWQPQP